MTQPIKIITVMSRHEAVSRLEALLSCCTLCYHSPMVNCIGMATKRVSEWRQRTHAVATCPDGT